MKSDINSPITKLIKSPIKKTDPAPSYDADALAHFTAVEAAGGSFDIDGTYTEANNKQAYSDFIAGLKTASLWSNVENLIIHPGKTFEGQLKAVVGSDLVNTNFVSGDLTPAGVGAGMTSGTLKQFTLGDNEAWNLDFSILYYFTYIGPSASRADIQGTSVYDGEEFYDRDQYIKLGSANGLATSNNPATENDDVEAAFNAADFTEGHFILTASAGANLSMILYDNGGVLDTGTGNLAPAMSVPYLDGSSSYPITSAMRLRFDKQLSVAEIDTVKGLVESLMDSLGCNVTPA